MIELPKSGAVLDKDLEIFDFSDGRRYGPRLGWLMTFHPCSFCLRNRHREGGASVLPECRRGQYGPCETEYLALWKETFIDKGAQFRLDNYGLDVETPQNNPRRTITM